MQLTLTSPRPAPSLQRPTPPRRLPSAHRRSNAPDRTRRPRRPAPDPPRPITSTSAREEPQCNTSLANEIPLTCCNPRQRHCNWNAPSLSWINLLNTQTTRIHYARPRSAPSPHCKKKISPLQMKPAYCDENSSCYRTVAPLSFDHDDFQFPAFPTNPAEI